jgi:hypothetical protein
MNDLLCMSISLDNLNVFLLIVIAILFIAVLVLAVRVLRLSAMVRSISAERETSLQHPAAPVEKPSLQAYNNSVHKFIVINDNIASLRKKDNRHLIQMMCKFLSGTLESPDKLKAEVRAFDMSDGAKEQFVSLLDEIAAFLTHDKQIIDAWLYHSGENEICNYVSAVRMPEGQMFDPALDSDVLGDDNSGMKISVVIKLGFHFPGNTVRPFRQKSTVLCM